MKVAVLFICTGEYWLFWDGFRKSAARHLLVGNVCEFFVFSDRPAARFAGADHVIHQDNLGWPLNTLYRFRMFLRIEEQLRAFDKIVFFNANCEFQQAISAEELFGTDADLLACRHPGLHDKPEAAYTYERRPLSTAGLPIGSLYVAGGLIGGTAAAFLSACHELRSNIEADFDRGILALWHDESHWNAYINRRCVELNRRVHVLDPGYLFPEDWNLPFAQRILLRKKSKVIDVHQVKSGQPPHPVTWRSQVKRRVKAWLPGRA